MTSFGSTLGALMKRTFELRCSDLHLQAGLRPRMRLQGELIEVEGSVALDEGAVRGLLGVLLPDGSQARLEAQGYVDFSVMDDGGTSWRGHAYRQRTGLALALRPLAGAVPSLEELRLPQVVVRLADLRSGLVLVTGPTGTGKTSTLAALTRRLAEAEALNIITIEDPLEYQHASGRSLLQQRAVGVDVPTFHQGVIDSLHEDPDVLLVGELRDLETVRAALTAAETGVLVLATLHANDAAQTVERILDLFENEELPLARAMLSQSLRAVVSQVLVDERTGKGRLPACEVMLQSPAISALIRAGRTHELRSAIQVAGEGMILLDDSLEALVQAGQVTPEEAARHARDPQRFARAVRLEARERPWWLGGALRRRPRAAAAERRHEARVQALTLVNVGEYDDLIGVPRELTAGRTRDLSHDGARLELDHPLLIGARLRLTFALEDVVIEADGEVRSVSREDDGRFQIGVRFGRLAPEAAQALDLYLRLHS